MLFPKLPSTYQPAAVPIDPSHRLASTLDDLYFDPAQDPPEPAYQSASAPTVDRATPGPHEVGPTSASLLSDPVVPTTALLFEPHAPAPDSAAVGTSSSTHVSAHQQPSPTGSVFADIGNVPRSMDRPPVNLTGTLSTSAFSLSSTGENRPPSSAMSTFLRQEIAANPLRHRHESAVLPTPAGGWPDIHHDSPTAIFANIQPSQLDSWTSFRRPSLFVQIHGAGARDEDVDPALAARIHQIMQTLSQYTLTPDLRLALPRPVTPVTALNTAPFTLFLYNISRETATQLLNMSSFITPNIALHFFPTYLCMPRYLGAIHGFIVNDTRPVRNLIRAGLSNDTVVERIETIARTCDHPLLLLGRIFPNVLASLEVRRLDLRARGGAPAPAFNIYILSPAVDYPSYTEWRDVIRNINIVDDFLGTGTLRSPGHCAGCHGHDHPTGLCPFLLVPTFPSSLHPSPPGPPRRPDRSRGSGR